MIYYFIFLLLLLIDFTEWKSLVIRVHFLSKKKNKKSVAVSKNQVVFPREVAF